MSFLLNLPWNVAPASSVSCINCVCWGRVGSNTPFLKGCLLKSLSRSWEWRVEKRAVIIHSLHSPALETGQTRHIPHMSCLSKAGCKWCWWKQLHILNNITISTIKYSLIRFKVHLVKAIVFSRSHVWMWEMNHKEGWVPKNWCFWTVCWRRLLRVPWITRRSNQSILKEINPEYSLEGLILKLKLQYFGHLLWRANLLEKALMLEKIEGRRRRGGREWGGWMPSMTQWTWVWTNSRRWWRTRKSGYSPWGHRQLDMTCWLNNNNNDNNKI